MSAKSNKFIFYGNGSYENKGCEAIVRGTIEILDLTFGRNSEFIAESAFYTDQMYEKQIINEPDPRIKHVKYTEVREKKLFEKFKPATILNKISYHLKLYGYLEDIERKKDAHRNIIGHVPDCTVSLSIGGDNYSLDYHNPRMYTDIDDIILHYKKPCILWGASVGPFSKDKAIEKFMSRHLKKLTGIFAREDKTINYLESIGVKNNVYRVSDPAFLMKPTEPENKDGLEYLKGAIGINLSHLIAKYWINNNFNEWVNYSAKLVCAVKKEFQRPIYLIPHVVDTNPMIPGFGNNDYYFLKTVLENIEDKTGIYLLPTDYSASETKYIISQLDLFIGARTHSTIAAFSTLVPTISIAYSIKAFGINQEVFGHTDFCLDKNSGRIENVIDLIKQILRDKNSIQENMSVSLKAIQERALNAGEILKTFLFR